MQTLTLEEAKAILSLCNKNTLKDSAFGDSEVDWYKDNNSIAYGYFGIESKSVTFTNSGQRFKFEEAEMLNNVQCAKETFESNS